MSWQNPWAWAGLVALALPVLIHLFSRRQARAEPFPTLRFLDASRLLPTRRTRVSDLLLLLLRVTILAVATAAFAQPLWRTDARRTADSASLARAIVVDTSGSMSRRAPTGNSTARDAALRDAARLGDSATVSTIVLTATPARALPGVVSWLRQQRGKGEVVILSDFQPDVIDRAALDVVPEEMGIVLVRIPAVAALADSAVHAEWPSGGGTLSVRAQRAAGHTTVQWTPTLAGASTNAHTLTFLPDANAQPRDLGAMRALLAVGGSPSVDARRPVVVVFPGYPARAALLREMQSPDIPWMVELAARVRADRVLREAARNALVLGDSLTGDAFLPVARSNAGRPVAVVSRKTGTQASASSGMSPGSSAVNATAPDTLYAFALVDGNSVAAAALLDALSRGARTEEPLSEQDPSSLDEATLRSLERPPSVADGRADGQPGRTAADVGESDARWLWLIVLLLLGAESWLRRPSMHDRRVPLADVAP